MATRRPTSLTLDAALLAEAKALGLNISRAAEEGVRRAIHSESAKNWQSENAEFIRQYNRMIEEEGVPLAAYRKF